MSSCIRLLIAFAVLSNFALGSARADTRTSAGESSGEGEGPLAGLLSSPEANLFSGSMVLTVDVLVPPGRPKVTPELKLVYSSDGSHSPFGYGWDLPIGRIERSTKHGTPNCTLHRNEFVLFMAGSAAELALISGATYRPKIDSGFTEATLLPDGSWQVEDADGMTYLFGLSANTRSDGLVPCGDTTVWMLDRIEDPHGNRIDFSYDKLNDTFYPREIRYGGSGSAFGGEHPFRVEFVRRAQEMLAPVVSYRNGVPAELRHLIERIDVFAKQAVGGAESLVRTYELEYDETSETRAHLVEVEQVAGADRLVRAFTYAQSTPNYGELFETSHEISKGIRTTNMSAQRDDKASVGRTLLDVDGDGALDMLKSYPGGETTWTFRKGGPNGIGQVAGDIPRPPVPGGSSSDDILLRQTVEGVDEAFVGFDIFDITGDGVFDFVDATNDDWVVYPGERSSSATGFRWSGAAVTWPLPIANGKYLEKQWENEQSQYVQRLRTYRGLLDINGDGRADLIVADRDEENGRVEDWHVYLNVGCTGSGCNPFVLDPSFVASGPITASLTNSYAALNATVIDHFDVNGDGLPDRVSTTSATQGSLNFDWTCVDASGSFSTILPDGKDVGVLLQGIDCPSQTAFAAIMRVWLNTGHGFEDAARLYPVKPEGYLTFGFFAGIRVASGRSVIADTLDLDGDGLPDRVTTTTPGGGFTSGAWSWQRNIGGRFRSVLWAQSQVAAMPAAIPVLQGEVRGSEEGGNDDSFNGPLIHDTREMIDWNADGFLDRVSSPWQDGNDRWSVRLFTGHDGARPGLMLTATNGLGGLTEVRYGRSTATGTNPHLPFIRWVVSAIRKTDGLCTPPENVDRFDPAANPCVASGNEILKRFAYEGGRFDGERREFAGFEAVSEIDADGNEKLSTFSQGIAPDLAETSGRLKREEVFAGSTLLRRKTITWATRLAGNSNNQTTLVYPGETIEEELADAPADELCVANRTDPPDDYGRILQNCTLACGSAGSGCGLDPVAGQVTTTTTWATPSSGHHVWQRPKSVVTRYRTEAGAVETLAEKKFYYDLESTAGEPSGAVTLGDLTGVKAPVGASYVGQTQTLSTYEYDAYGNVERAVDGIGATTLSNFSGSPFALYAKLEAAPPTPGNHWTIRTLDLRYGKPSEILDENSAKTEYQYDALGRTVCHAEPGQTCTSGPVAARYDYEYGDQTAASFEGKLSFVEVQRREPANPTSVSVSRTYVDALGRARFKTEQRVVAGALQTVVESHTVYDRGGRIKRVYAPYVKPPGGVVELPAESFTSFSYELNGGGVIDPLGRPHVEDPPDSTQTTRFYHGRRSTVEDAAGTVISVTRNHLGHEVLEDRSSPGHSSPATMSFERKFDGLGRLIWERTSGNVRTIVTRAYDRLGRLVQMVDPDSGEWRYGYDGNGNLIFEDRPADGWIELRYDALNRLKVRCLFGNGATADAYSGACTEASPAWESKYAYDDLANGGAANGRLTLVQDRSGSERFVYDERGRVLMNEKTVDGASKILEFTYNDANRIATIEYPDGEIVEYVEDATGRVYQVRNADDYVYLGLVHYDLLGKASHVGHGNAVLEEWSYGPATSGHRLSSLAISSGSISYLNTSFTYTNAGKVLTIADARPLASPLNSGGTFLYDGLGRLETANWASTSSSPNPPVPDETFDHDEIGNLTVNGGAPVSYPSTGAPHWANAVNGRAYGHDDRGRVFVRTDLDGGWSNFIYDGLDRISRIEHRASGNALEGEVSFGYDHAGTRVKRTNLDGTVARFFNQYLEARDGLLIKYYYAEGRLIASRRTVDVTVGMLGGGAPWAPPPWLPGAMVLVCGSVLLLIIAAPGRKRNDVRVGILVAPSRALGTASLLLLLQAIPILMAPQCGGDGSPVRHYHVDHLGSTIAITSGDSGGPMLEQIRYTAYGKVRGRWDGFDQLLSGNPTEDERFEWTGHESEHEAALVYAGARFYDSVIGQFLTHDPKRQYASPYAYGPGDPVNGSDPDGTWFFSFGLNLFGMLLPLAGFSTSGDAGSGSGSSFSLGDLAGGSKANNATAGGQLSAPVMASFKMDRASLAAAHQNAMAGLGGTLVAANGAAAGFEAATSAAVGNDAVRARMADIAEAYLGDAAFAKDARYGKWPAGSWKCNCFVESVIESAGGTAPKYPGGQWPLRANDWADPDLDISGWAIVTSPQRGDVAAFPRSGDSGHVGIFVGGFGRQVIGAGRDGVSYSTTHLFTRFGLNSLSGATGPIVYRRWVGSE